MALPSISKLRLPSGNTYELKDAYARQLLAAGLQFVVCWDGTSVPVVANIPAGVTVTYNGIEYTGTKPASSAEPLTFYLVKEVNNAYGEYVSIKSGSGTELDPYVYTWEKLGDTSIDLSNYVTTTALNTALSNYTTTANLPFVKGTGTRSAIQNGTGAVASGTNSVAEGNNTSVSGESSHVEGLNSLSEGPYMHIEGANNYGGSDTTKEPISSDYGLYNGNSAGAHVEGQGSVVINSPSTHIEGNRNKSTSSRAAHIEGKQNTISSANYAHVEGLCNTVSAEEGHAEGFQSEVTAMHGHAEGWYTYVSGRAGHAEGYNTQAVALYSHAEGQSTIAQNQASHTEGESTNTLGQDSHAEGYNSQTGGDSSITSNTKIAGTYTGNGAYAHAEGNATIALGISSHAEGKKTLAKGTSSHAEGLTTKATGEYSHAEGNYTTASDEAAHSEGVGTTASAYSAHAEGYNSSASGIGSHAEGGYYYMSGQTIDSVDGGSASGKSSHAEGGFTAASGDYSHVEGYYTQATNDWEHADGIYNKSNTKTTGTPGEQEDGTTLHSIGFGDMGIRRNAFETMRSGKIYVYGVGGYDGTNPATTGINDIATVINSNANRMESITWSSLKALRDGGQLIPGMQYRITDYTCTTTQANTQSANHPFDIIVTADSENTINENARAIQHSGDTYFANSDLAAWELKYSLDNDTTKFAWADSGSTGRGVIYWMKDEWNNECPYDFKNIRFSFRPTFEAKQYGVTSTYSSNGEVVNIDNVNYYGYTRTRKGSGPPPPPEKLYVTETVIQTGMSLYTIADNVATLYTNATVDSVTSVNYDSYTFDFLGEDASMSLANKCYSNTIDKYIKDGLQELNWIFFKSTGSSIFNCYNNAFKLNCRYMTFDYSCYSNTFGSNCYSNTFGADCTSNTLGNNCYSNTFGYNCSFNTFGTDCIRNTLGAWCQYNSFESACFDNAFSANCRKNIFGNDCQSNTFGNNCSYNTFGSGCTHIKFGTSSTMKSYCSYNIVESGNQYIYIDVTGTTSSSSQYRNVKIAQGVNNTMNYKTITDNNVNQTFQTVYQPANSKVISV